MAHAALCRQQVQGLQGGRQSGPACARHDKACVQAWACMEARQGDAALVRDLFRRGLKESPKSPYLHLAFGQWERQQGSLETARFLLRRGCQLTPTDPALAVVRTLSYHVRFQLSFLTCCCGLNVLQ